MNQKSQFNLINRNVMFLLLSIYAFSCVDKEVLPTRSIEQIGHEIYSGEIVTINLDPTYVHVSRSFNSLEEHDNYLEDFEQNNEITLNRQMYYDLKHYFEPHQIALIDSKYMIEIGDEKFKVDSEAVYKLIEGEWEVTVFYGPEGDVDLRETEMVFENLGQLHLLDDYEFKSPASKSVLDRFTNASGEARTEAHTEHIIPITSDNWFGLDNACMGCSMDLAYPKEYKADDGTIHQARFRAVVWNEENSQWGTNAKAGTKLQMMDLSPGGTGLAFNWITPFFGQYYGSHPGISRFDDVPPYTYLKLVTHKHREEYGHRWYISRSGPRKSGRKALSNHYIDYHDPLTGGDNRRLLTVDRFD